VTVSAIIADTGPLVALLNGTDKHHEQCLDFLGRFRGPIIVPAPVLTEVAYLTERSAGPEVEAAFLESLARGDMRLEAVAVPDLDRMAELVRQYSDFPLGTVDAAVVAVAERLGLSRIATLDHRHFRAVRPRHCTSFELLP
jgi:uncharacterized protein